MASDLEREWYGLCNGNDFIEQAVVESFVQRLKGAGKHVAIAVGLHDFYGAQCVRCGASGQFRIHFLGELHHSKCGCKWYMGTGSYIGLQLSSVIHSGIWAGGGMKADADRKGDRSGGWVNGIFGFIFVGVFRAALAVVLIPLHTVAALCQTGQTKAAVASRAVILAAVLALVGTGAYEINNASKIQSPPQPVQPASKPVQTPYNLIPA